MTVDTILLTCGIFETQDGADHEESSLRISRKLQGLNHCEASTTLDFQLHKASHFFLKSLSSPAVICAASTDLDAMVLITVK